MQSTTWMARVYDGFLIHDRGAYAAASGDGYLLNDGGSPATGRVRADLGAPVLETHEAFVRRFRNAVRRIVRDGFWLKSEADEALRAAQRSSIGRQSDPVHTQTKILPAFPRPRQIPVPAPFRPAQPTRRGIGGQES
jgi:hypothetical protein